MGEDLEILDTKGQQATAKAAAVAETEPDPAQGGRGGGHRGPDRGGAAGAGQHCRAHSLSTLTTEDS